MAEDEAPADCVLDTELLGELDDEDAAEDDTDGLGEPDADALTLSPAVDDALGVPLSVADGELEGALELEPELEDVAEPALEVEGVLDALALAEADGEAAAVDEDVGLPDALG